MDLKPEKRQLLLACLDKRYSLICGSHNVLEKGGWDTLAVIGGNLAFGIGLLGANQSGSSLGKYCGKMLLEFLARKSLGTGWRGKSQFKKGSDLWKFSI